MGMLDSLGNLGGLGQITKALDPGNWIKQGLNSVLPKNMAVVGDAAGALFDLKTGNLLGAAQLGMQAMKDLPQATKSLQQQGPQGAANDASTASANPNLEPSPPPNASKPVDMNKLQELLNQLLQMFSGKQNTATSTTGTLSSEDAKHFAQQAFAAKANGAFDPGTRTTTTTTTTTHESVAGWRGSPATPADSGTSSGRASAESSAWVGQPRTPALSTTPAATSTPAPATNTPPPTASAAPTNSAVPSSSTPPAPVADPLASASGPSSGQTISSLAQFNSMSDSAVRDAVIHGRISPDLAKDQTAMMAIQQRMNAISEMNNLLTNMMRALHDMQMAVIQNVRA